MILCVVITLIITIIFSLYLYFVWNFNYWKKLGVKGPKPKLIFGNISGIFTNSQHITYDIDKIYCQYKNEERFIGYYFGRQPRLLLLDPKLIRDVVLTSFKNFQNNDTFFPVDPKLDPLIAQTPFFLTGNAWKQKRAEITPALTISRIKAIYPIMLEACNKMTKYLDKEFVVPPKDGIKAENLAERFTCEVVSNSIFGLDAGAFTMNECPIIEEGNKIFASNETFEIFYVFVSAVFPFIRKIFKKPVIAKRTEQFFTSLMEDAVKHREETKDERNDFLNYLIQLRDKKNLSLLDMAANAITFFVDGFSTSSVLIAHIMHVLAKYKNVQEKLRQEIKDASGNDGNLTFEKLSELIYLDCVVNETLRMYPLVTTLGKVCNEPHEFINSNGKSFWMEKNQIAVYPIYSLHRDEQYYPDPDKFIPERFSPENGGLRKYKDMGVYYPFGEGPRQCLGMRFGLIQTKACIAGLVSKWNMSVNSKTLKDFSADPKAFLFQMDGGIWIDFERI